MNICRPFLLLVAAILSLAATDTVLGQVSPREQPSPTPVQVLFSPKGGCTDGRIAASAFEGYLVRKDLVRRYAKQYPVPTYVVEFLLGRYCASIDPREIEEGLAIVEKQLRGRTVRTGHEELFKA